MSAKKAQSENHLKNQTSLDAEARNMKGAGGLGTGERFPYLSNSAFSDDDDNIDLHLPHTNAGYKSVKMDNILYSKYEAKVRPCIDLVDSLRALGVERDLALPAIAVIGDQSSGKSSVLEALSGVTLPRGNGIVTRCPLELKLKKVKNATNWNGRISYEFHNEQLTIQLKDPSEVEGAIILAQNALAGAGLGICDKLISLEIASPDMPDLTLLDLPGIARVAVGNQPKDIGDQIKRLISKYIKRQETISLVVVPSNIDIVTTEALEMVRQVDPKGERTLGVLTKPDLVDRGAEKAVVDIVNNKTIPLKKGYMIVKCRGQQDIKNKLSLNEALEKEKIFFDENKHFRSLLNNGLATIPVLAERLTAELVEHICKSLPLLERQIKEKLLETGDALERYGKGVPETEGERLPYLIQLINKFIDDIMKYSCGEENVFNSEKEKMFTKVRSQFASWQDSLDANNQEFKNMQLKISKLEEMQKRLRGRELPGFMNYRTFEDIIRKQIKMMEEPAVQTLKHSIHIVQTAFNDIASDHFVNLPNLRTAAKDTIDQMRRRQEEESEKMIRTQFKMENAVHSQDALYFCDLKKVREAAEKDHSLPPEKKPTFSLPITNEKISLQGMSYHLEAYLEGTARRLTNQIPLIIRYCILEEFANNLQTEMLKLLKDKDNYEELLQENDEFSHKRNRLRDRIKRLNKAYTRLLQFPS